MEAAAAREEAAGAAKEVAAAQERAAAAEEALKQAQAEAQASAALAERLAVGTTPSPGADGDAARRSPVSNEGRRRSTASRASRTLLKQVNATQAQVSQLRTELAAAGRREAVNADVNSGLQRQVKALKAELAAANDALAKARAAPAAQLPPVQVPELASGESKALMEQISDLTERLYAVAHPIAAPPPHRASQLRCLTPATGALQVQRVGGAAAHRGQGSTAAAHGGRA